MGKEIERKFLIKGETPFDNKTPKLIKQGYVIVEKNRHLRVRLIGNKGILGLKFINGPVRDEFEYPIDIEEANEIYNKCRWSLEKKRITGIIDDLSYDIDEYPNGIRVVEVEFPKERYKFKKPKWMGKEVSKNKKYSNITLAKKNLRF